MIFQIPGLLAESSKCSRHAGVDARKDCFVAEAGNELLAILLVAFLPNSGMRLPVVLQLLVLTDSDARTARDAG